MRVLACSLLLLSLVNPAHAGWNLFSRAPTPTPASTKVKPSWVAATAAHPTIGLSAAHTKSVSYETSPKLEQMTSSMASLREASPFVAINGSVGVYRSSLKEAERAVQDAQKESSPKVAAQHLARAAAFFSVAKEAMHLRNGLMSRKRRAPPLGKFESARIDKLQALLDPKGQHQEFDHKDPASHNRMWGSISGGFMVGPGGMLMQTQQQQAQQQLMNSFQ